MKKILLLLLVASYALQSSAQTTITVMDSLIYFDGYAAVVTSPPPPAGVIRHRNDLFARKLTTSEIQSIGTTLQMNVVLHALCDNYDRIGNVNLALVPAGATTYTPDSVQRIELARFITPFFNKNVQPDSVPYTFAIDNGAMLLKDTGITNHFDLWMELAVFGVPYAANTQVAGCSGRNDVFMGRLQLVTNAPAAAQSNNTLLPLFFNANFNNYQAGATDTVGKTTKKITFTVPTTMLDASFYLITSNHGANSGGEEYNRRFHYAYFDDSLMLTYKPGRTTCEPFRQYNTQSNGIYGSSPKSSSQWQSFSNWCPGDVIDIRQIHLGPVTAGSHSFMIQVPTAVFNGGQGNFPLSLYFQGKAATVHAGINDNVEEQLVAIYPNPTTGQFTVETNTDQSTIAVIDMLGNQILKTQASQKATNLQIAENGVYIVYITTKQGTTAQKLVVRR